MIELIQEIDVLMDEIDTDTNKTSFPTFYRKVLELSQIYWEAKRQLIMTKNKYDREFVMKKEQRKQELERLQDIEVSKDEKYKRTKITNVEVETYTELDLLPLKQEQEEPAMTVAYLEPLLKWYMERWNAVKFSTNINTRERFNDNQS